MALDDGTRDYLRALRDSRRWNLDLRPLREEGVEVAGIVLHDEFSALCGTQRELQKSYGFKVYESDASKRFRGLIVDVRRNGLWKRVLLQETGMGSMNASLVTYELAAALLDKGDAAKRIIKVGTCSGLYGEMRAGTVLAPLYALPDEGATRWNKIREDISVEEWLFERFREAYHSTEGAASNGGIANQWLVHLRTIWPDCIGDRGGGPEWWLGFGKNYGYPEGINPRPAIWSIDNFHGVRSVATRIYGEIEKWVRNDHPDPVPLVFENECSSHYSACSRVGLDIAVALVVSWSSGHIREFVKKLEDPRGDEKASVHQTEASLIVEAVKFLLSA